MRVIASLLLVYLLSWTVQSQAPAEAVISDALRVQLDSLETTTARLRELPFLHPVTVIFPSTETVRAKLGGMLDAQLTPERVADAMAFYVAFDLMQPDVDLRAVFDALYQQQVGGFYELESKEMNVLLLSGGTLGDALPLLERIIAVHEYVHALQDQHFDLTAYLNMLENAENDDLVLAHVALVEGDATYIMNRYAEEEITRNPLGALLSTLSGALASGDIPPGTPPILAQELLFPYLQGEEFVRALLRDGGMARLNAAFANPPTSTMHIIHPQKYLSGQAPVTVALSDLSGRGWTLNKTGVLGEFYLREYLKTQAVPAANRAAAGWAGDAYQLYSRDDGATAWRLALVWENASEAAEFAQAWQHFAQARWGVSVDASDPAPQCFERVDTPHLCFVGLGSSDTVLAVAPDLAFAQALLEK